MQKILEINLYSENYVLLGGYDRHYWRNIKGLRIEEHLRPQSLKGLWRWWARAYIAGALYDLIGNTDINKVISITGEMLGDAERGASKVFLKIPHTTCRGRPTSIQKSNIGRINLLTSFGKTALRLVEDLRATVILLERPRANMSTEERAFLIGSLLTSLILSGLGKGGRRGLGTFNLNIRYSATEEFRSLTRTGSSLLPDDYDQASKVIKQIIEKTLESAKKIASEKLKSKGARERASATWPRIPAITLKEVAEQPDMCFFMLYMLKPKVSTRGMHQMLVDVNNFVVRSKRGIDGLTRNKLAWILGLPREQLGKGYFSWVERRASPLIFAVHKRWFLASLFVSADWPQKITWKGAQPLPINVSSELPRAYKSLIDVFNAYFNRNYTIKRIL